MTEQFKNQTIDSPELVNDLLKLVRQQTQTLLTQERLLRRHERNQKQLLDELSNLTAEVKKFGECSQERRDALDYFASASLAPTLDSVWNFLSQTQLSLKATLERLAKTDVSFTRLGDGEFKLMLSPWRNLAFQKNSFELIERLEDVAASEATSLLVGLPQFMRNTNYLKLWPKIWGHLITLLSQDATYGNSHVSRPLAFKFLGEEAVELWREVWRDKTLTVITGRGSRFDTVPALFDSASKIERIESTPKDAFSDLSRILNLVRDNEADIFIVSLGPAGTILAHDIAVQGRRALDIGHLSAAYLNIVEGREVPENTPMTR